MKYISMYISNLRFFLASLRKMGSELLLKKGRLIFRFTKHISNVLPRFFFIPNSLEIHFLAVYLRNGICASQVPPMIDQRSPQTFEKHAPFSRGICGWVLRASSSILHFCYGLAESAPAACSVGLQMVPPVGMMRVENSYSVENSCTNSPDLSTVRQALVAK